MLKEKIKRNLHTIIDDVEDDYILKHINDVIHQIIDDKNLKWASLSEEEKKSILTGLSQLESDDYIYYEDMKKEMNEWKRK